MKITFSNNNFIPMKELPNNKLAVIVEGGYAGILEYKNPYHFSEGSYIALNGKNGIAYFSAMCEHKVRVLESGETFTVEV